ncbi:MAG TPA: arsinothricin resistance N-acetyltransferase ArsN1 family B [Gemmatimonadaceae bacterium]|nr:arsinothricin resistance N-acetyltransferase ArsN1 family B [Gemmatimonadaceae bacterium]
MPIIRVATAVDGPAFAEIYRPAVVGSPISFEVDPPDGAEMARRVETIGARYPWLAFDDDGATIGYAYASPHRARPAYQWSAEVSAYVHADARRRGVARALYTSLFASLRLLGYCNAYAGITLPNPASVGLHEALGFRSVGVFHDVGHKLGRWHDVGWWERPLGDRIEHPDPPRNIDELIGSDAFVAALSSGYGAARTR